MARKCQAGDQLAVSGQNKKKKNDMISSQISTPTNPIAGINAQLLGALNETAGGPSLKTRT